MIIGAMISAAICPFADGAADLSASLLLGLLLTSP
jgi:hypothetical protein